MRPHLLPIATLFALGLCLAPSPALGRPSAIVALGDSFISGEGGRWLGNGSEPLGTSSGTDRAAFDCDSWGCDYDPECGGCPVWDADADWSTGAATDTLAAGCARPGRRAGPSSSISATRSTATSSATAAPVGWETAVPHLTAEWLRRLSFVQGSSRESLHPNAYGQRAIGACLGLLLARPRGDYACIDTSGQFLAGMGLQPAS